jgi:hypothetical protein
MIPYEGRHSDSVKISRSLEMQFSLMISESVVTQSSLTIPYFNYYSTSAIDFKP